MGGRGSKGKPAGAAASGAPAPGTPVDPKFKEGQTLASNPTYSAISNAIIPKGGGYSPATVDYVDGKVRVGLRKGPGYLTRGQTAEQAQARDQRGRALTEQMLSPTGYKIKWDADGKRGTVVH